MNNHFLMGLISDVNHDTRTYKQRDLIMIMGEEGWHCDYCDHCWQINAILDRP